MLFKKDSVLQIYKGVFFSKILVGQRAEALLVAALATQSLFSTL
jgi:hypothetical protein